MSGQWEDAFGRQQANRLPRDRPAAKGQGRDKKSRNNKRHGHRSIDANIASHLPSSDDDDTSTEEEELVILPSPVQLSYPADNLLHSSSSRKMYEDRVLPTPRERRTHALRMDENYAHGPMSSASSHMTTGSKETEDTAATSLELGPLQAKEDLDEYHPIEEEDQGSFDLVAPAAANKDSYSLEARSEAMFSVDHLRIIFSEPSLLLRFTSFIADKRPKSLPTLIYYLDAIKAIKAISYSNAVVDALEPLVGKSFEFTHDKPVGTANREVEEKARQAFEIMTQEDLPAYMTHLVINVVAESIGRRITGTLAPHLREASEGLAEVFCLTDPSRRDNPIVFASQEFHRTTQYGVNYAIGRNCRFLQGPKTSPYSVRRLKEACEAGKEHSELFLNYRRDGSSFMNLLMIAPLCDSRGKVRYFIGAQVDVSGLMKDCTGVESLQRLVVEEMEEKNNANGDHQTLRAKRDEFQDLCEMFNLSELESVRRFGGRMHRDQDDDDIDGTAARNTTDLPRLLLQENSSGDEKQRRQRTPTPTPNVSGRLLGVYQNYLLIRPFPSLRILFASPSLRVPGILQSPFLSRIGGSSRVRDELSAALAEGRGVTAKIRWVTRFDEEGRSRWIHCTPLLGSNGAIGVWMIVLVDDDRAVSTHHRRWKQAPPIPDAPTPMPEHYHAGNGVSGVSTYANANGIEHAVIRPPTRSGSTPRPITPGAFKSGRMAKLPTERLRMENEMAMRREGGVNGMTGESPTQSAFSVAI